MLSKSGGIERPTRVTFIGNITRDIVITREGIVKSYWGGSALNAALAAACSRVDVAVVSAVGVDFPVARLAARGVDTNGIEVDNGWSSVFTRHEGSKMVSFFPHRRVTADSTDGLGDFLHISIRDGVEFSGAVESSVSHVSCDVMEHSLDRNAVVLKSLRRAIDMFFCNETEAEFLEAQDWWPWDSVPMDVLITGRDTVRWCARDGREWVFEWPTKDQTELVSDTGAGDVFLGGVLGGRAAGKEMSESIRRAIGLARVSLRSCGAWNLWCSSDEVDDVTARIEVRRTK